jgi:hypothetical protein
MMKRKDVMIPTFLGHQKQQQKEARNESKKNPKRNKNRQA